MHVLYPLILPQHVPFQSFPFQVEWTYFRVYLSRGVELLIFDLPPRLIIISTRSWNPRTPSLLSCISVYCKEQSYLTAVLGRSTRYRMPRPASFRSEYRLEL